MLGKTLYAAGFAFMLMIEVISPGRISSAAENPQAQDWKTVVATLQDSLKELQLQVDSLRQRAPGLGEYMTTMQLHTAKLWFAVKSLNWDLALYEVDELSETIDGAKALHAYKNNVNISGVLESVQATQIQLVRQAIVAKRQKPFSSGYKQTIDACNGCHRSAGYGFISIIAPTSPPVVNQRWDAK
jgi:hypothetical protein